jgi:hypothetical protein
MPGLTTLCACLLVWQLLAGYALHDLSWPALLFLTYTLVSRLLILQDLHMYLNFFLTTLVSRRLI